MPECQVGGTRVGDEGLSVGENQGFLTTGLENQAEAEAKGKAWVLC